MSNELVKVNEEGKSLVPTGGHGIDFGSKLFNLKPATLSIVQKMSQVANATPGKLRINETGEEFDLMTVVLLAMPVEWRDYHIGEKGGLNRTQENLMCFSRDLIRPDARSKDPQALT